jgi:NADH-quinone oxidoreductase subunit G
VLRFRFEQHIREHGDDKVAVMLSPFAACEEAWLLIRFIRELAPNAALAMGLVPEEGENQLFPVGATGEAVKFTIRKEKCPNRRGIEMLLDSAGGKILTFAEFVEKAGEFSAAWIVGGYPKPWVGKDLGKIAAKLQLLVVQDLFENELTKGATVLLPACAWAEREGSFVNTTGLIQPFEWAINPPDGAKRDGQYLYEIAGYEGIYSSERVRELMAATIPAFADICEAQPRPAHAH